MTNANYIEWVYDTLMGNLEEEYRCSGVENLFAEGEPCVGLYTKMIEAYWRLCSKLNVQEDADGEIMINAMLEMMRIVACKMYAYGQKHAWDSN